jgi:NDP-sugar pyrophosphorylase family protein
MIKSYFTDINPDYDIHYVEEDMPLGTAGSIKLITDKFSSPVIITNCDTLIDVNFEELMEHHKASGNALTIVSALKNITVPYGVMYSKENGIITSMEEKPQMSYFINTGLYVLDSELIEKIPDNTMFHMTHLADLLMKEGYQVGMYPISEEAFLDMGEFEEMKRMEEKLNIVSN